MKTGIRLCAGVLFIFCLAIPNVVAQAAPANLNDPKLADEAIAWFSHQSPTAQRKILDAVAKDPALDAVPWIASTRALAAEAAAAKPRAFQTQSKVSPDGSFPLSEELPFPFRKEYVFGARTIRPIDAVRRDAVKPVDELRSCLAGLPPNLDLALAQLLSDLDNDKSADDFALFLESWRNGDESFYRALDRTAGTPQEVFYYDAMLGQFNQKILKGDDFTKKKPAARDLKKAHDYLHDGFLVYRQYRALREAAALALLLPPYGKLPKNLSRYEQKPANLYSMKEVLQIFVVASKYNLKEVVKLVLSTTPAMPESIWEAKYEPLQPLMDLFTKKVAEYNEEPTLGSPEVLLKKYRDARADAVSKVKDATRRALSAGGCPVYASKG